MAEAFSFILLGVLYGSTVCSFTCMPYLGVYVIGTGNSFREGVEATLIFLAGKICVYVLFGIVAGAVGKTLDISGLQGKIFGVILIASGLLLPFVAGRRCGGACRHGGRKLSLFALGCGTGLLPCPPMLSLLLLAAQKGSWLAGATYGVMFGLGQIVSPILLAGGGLAHLAGKIRLEVKNFTPYLRLISMMIMVFLGIRAFV